MFINTADYRHIGLLILRVAIGSIFFLHGLGKFGLLGIGDLQGTAGFFGSLGIPAPELTALVVASVETFGGLALILGLGTQVASVLLSGVMLVAIVTAKIPTGGFNPVAQGGFELELALLASVVTLFFTGPGPISVDARAPWRRQTVQAHTTEFSTR